MRVCVRERANKNYVNLYVRDQSEKLLNSIDGKLTKMSTTVPRYVLTITFLSKGRKIKDKGRRKEERGKKEGGRKEGSRERWKMRR